MRLQKFLSEAGVTSRRKAEALIEAERISVNGKVVSALGSKVVPETDVVCLDGKQLKIERKLLYLFHKPSKVITSLQDPQGRKTITDFTKSLPVRVFPVGRLDYDVSGILLLTNDGDWADRILHPRNQTPRVYWAIVAGDVLPDTFSQLKRGVSLEDGEGKVTEVKKLAETKTVRRVLRELKPGQSAIEVTVEEGRNHFVKRILEAVGIPVKRLVRVRFGPYSLGDLAPGEIRESKF